MVRSFAAVILCVFVFSVGCQASHSGEKLAIEYRGEEIRLTKHYESYEDYSKDPDDIAPEDYERVKKLVESAPVPERCVDSREVIRVTFAVKFPYYGLRGLGTPDAGMPPRVIGTSIEIPHANAERYVVYLMDERGYRLVDDWVLPDEPDIAAVRVDHEKVVYLTREGTVVAKRPVRKTR